MTLEDRDHVYNQGMQEILLQVYVVKIASTSLLHIVKK